MQNSLINPHNFALNPHTFPLPNGISNHNHHNNDIDMIALHSINYTSLKDLMPASPPSTASPTCSLGDSWREIPIKDPLLQHAAWAYLQPMVEQPGEDEYRWWRRLQEKCCWLFGCFNDVVLVVFEGWFSEQVTERLMIKVDRQTRESIKKGKLLKA